MLNYVSAKNLLRAVLLLLFVILFTGCDLVPLHMRNQPKYKPNRATTFWPNGTSSRPIPENTVPRGEWYEIISNEELYTGMNADGEFVQDIPIEVDQDVLLRGQEQFNIYCSPCHGQVGTGNGMIVQRGFPPPPSFHIDRLRNEADGYFYDVITNGFGVMYSYASRVEPRDRWAIVAYIRALQYSQNAPVDSLPEEDVQQIESLSEEDSNESN